MSDVILKAPAEDLTQLRFSLQSASGDLRSDLERIRELITQADSVVKGKEFQISIDKANQDISDLEKQMTGLSVDINQLSSYLTEMIEIYYQAEKNLMGQIRAHFDGEK